MHLAKWLPIGALLTIAVAASACLGAEPTPSPARAPSSTATPEHPADVSASGPPLEPAAYDGQGASSDVRYPIELSGTLRTLLSLDAIRPIYDPSFVTATDAPLLDDDLVIGVSLNGDSRAYPVRLLRQREMVNDVVGGVPILATW